MKAICGRIRSLWVAAPMSLLVLHGCGGGGGGGTDSPAAPAPTTVSGTVATGKPLANAQVVLADSNGASKSATSSSTGRYSVDVTGMTAPFVVRATGAQASVSTILVSVIDTVDASTGNVINVTPWTTAVAAMVSSTGKANDLDAVKDKARITSSLLSVSNYAKAMMEPSLTAAGLFTTAGPITTEFSADGTGYDSIYDHLLVGQTLHGTIFMAPKRPGGACGVNIGGCWTASSGDQSTTNPNLCGSDIATGAPIACDPTQPITANPSVTLPAISLDSTAFDVALGVARVGPGVADKATNTNPSNNTLALTGVTPCVAGSGGCIPPVTPDPAPVTPPPPTSGTFTGSWDCGTSSQCAAAFGTDGARGTKTFPSLSACQAFFAGTTFGSSCRPS